MDETTRLRALLEQTERERDDLAATLETRTAEHALAMEQLAAVTAERDVLRAQQAPLLDAHDALVAAARAAGWMGAGATGAELVAWVRRGALLDAARIAEHRGHVNTAMAIIATIRKGGE